MSKSNCISTFYFAEMYQCDELITNTRKFIHANFASVAEMDEFLNLEAKEVERWISNDEISVAFEGDVFKIILKWIEQKKSERKAWLEQLFRHVRLTFLSRDVLLHVLTNELVRENFVCLKLVSDAVKLTSFPSEANLSRSPRKGLETRAIVACGGKYTFCYLPEKDEWKRLADGLSAQNHGTKMISCCDQLYTFSYLPERDEWKRLADRMTERNHGTEMVSCYDQLYILPPYTKAERYDPVFNCWSSLDLQLYTLWSAKVAVVRGEIYAIEVNTSTNKSTIKRYDIEQCSWQTVLSSHEGCRGDSCVVAAGNHLYVCGGIINVDYVTKAERFDTVENKWEEIANMKQKRARSFGVATEGKIFLAGGMQAEGMIITGWLKTCEMYNTSTNEWPLIGSLNVSRANGSMVCLRGTLYVVGGTNTIRGSQLSVECYDPTEDKWIMKTTIPVKRISKDNKDTFTSCVLKLSKGVLDKLDVIQNVPD